MNYTKGNVTLTDNVSYNLADIAGIEYTGCADPGICPLKALSFQRQILDTIPCCDSFHCRSTYVCPLTPRHHLSQTAYSCVVACLLVVAGVCLFLPSAGVQMPAATYKDNT